MGRAEEVVEGVAAHLVALMPKYPCECNEPVKESDIRLDVVEVVRALVTELGITEEMVDNVRAAVGLSGGFPGIANQTKAAADALSTLLEIASE